MKPTVKRVRGGVVIKLGLRHAKDLMEILNYSGLNERFEKAFPVAFGSSEIVAQMIFDRLEDEGVDDYQSHNG